MPRDGDLRHIISKLFSSTVFSKPPAAIARRIQPGHSLLVALEPRLVFDGALVPTIDAATPDANSANTDADSDGDDGDAPDAHDDTHATEQAGIVAAMPRREVVFLDRNIRDVETLAASLEGKADIYWLDPAKNGVVQIGEVLAQYDQVDAVHIYSHADAAGHLMLGKTELTLDNIDSYSANLAAWGEHLSADADIMLYGCDLAAGDDGRVLVQKIAEHTGADIAASDDVTGAAAENGDWDLEYTFGDIEAAVLSSAEFSGYMAAPALSGWDNANLDPIAAQAGPVLIDADVTLTGGLANYDGWELLVQSSIFGGEDILSIRNEGTGAGQVGFTDAGGGFYYVSYGGNYIGYSMFGSGGVVVYFTSAFGTVPTNAMVERVIENITYQNMGPPGNPTLTRDVAIQFKLNGGPQPFEVIDSEVNGSDGVVGMSGSEGVVVSPDGKNVYVASADGDSIVIFTRNETTGEVVYQNRVVNGSGGVTGMTSPASITISDNGQSVYVGDRTGKVFFFTRNTSTGELTYGADYTAPQGVYGDIILSADQTRVFVADTTGFNAFIRNTTTGALTAVSNINIPLGGGGNLADMVVSPDGKHIYHVWSGNLSLITRDTTTDALTYTALSIPAGFNQMQGIAISSDGNFVYISDAEADSIVVYSRNSTTGALTQAALYQSGSGGFNNLETAGEIRLSPDGTRLFVLGSDNSTLHAFIRNTTTGALTPDMQLGDGAFNSANDMAISADGKSIYTIRNSSMAVVRFDLNIATEVMSDDITVTLAPPPPPAITNWAPSSITTTAAQAGPVLIDSDISITGGYANYNGWILQLSSDASTSVQDILAVRNQGLGPGNILVSGSNISYDGTLIGTFTGGTAGVPLRITLNANSNNIALDALIENMTYQQVSGGTTGTRNLTLSLTDSGATGALTYVGQMKDGVSGVDGLDGASGVVTSADGKFVYVASADDNSIAIFSRNTTTGALTYISRLVDGTGGVDGLNYVQGITLSHDGKFIYSAGYGDGGIGIFSRDATTGALTYVGVIKEGGGVDGLTFLYSIAASSDGNHLYVASSGDNAVSIFSRNQTTGMLTYVGMMQDGVGGVDGIAGTRDVIVSPDGKHVYVSGYSDNAIAIFTRNATTGALTYVSRLVDGSGPTDLAGAWGVTISPDGRHVYVTGYSDNAVSVFSRNATTGALTYASRVKDGTGGVDGLAFARDVTVSPDGKHVYAISGVADNAVAVFTRNASTGALTYVGVLKDGAGGVDGLNGAASVIVSADGKNVYVASGGDDALAVFTRNIGNSVLFETTLDIITPPPPTISNWSPASITTTTAQSGPVLIDSDITITNGYANYNGWVLQLSSDALVQDILAVRNQGSGAGQIGVSGSNITYGGVTIGTFTGGSAGLPLRITLNANATNAVLEALVENMTYQQVSGGTAGTRNLTLSLTDATATGGLTYTGYLTDGVGGVNGIDGAKSVVTSPDGKHVYVAGGVDDAVAIFTRDATTGALTYIGRVQNGTGGVDGLDGVRSVTISPDGKHLYAGGEADNAIAFFSRDAVTGNLTYIGMLEDGVGGVDGLFTVKDVTVSPDGKHVYVAGGNDNSLATFARNQTTGALTYVGLLRDGVGGVDGLSGTFSVIVSPDGKFVYAVSTGDAALSIFSRDVATGALNYIGMMKDGVGGVDGLASPRDVTMSPDGKHIYAAGRADNAISIFTRDATTGALTYVGMMQDGVGGVDGLTTVTGVAVSADGVHVYATSNGDNSVAVFARNATTGALTYVGVLKDGAGGVDGLAGANTVFVSPDGKHVYVASETDDAVAIFQRDIANSVLFTTTLDVTPVPPVITNWAPASVYAGTVQTGPVLIDSDITITGGYADYNGWILRLSSDASGYDNIAVRNQGVGAGQIGVSGSDITYGGTVIGSFTGGTVGLPLMITLNANADNAAVEALVENMTYQQAPGGLAGTRTLALSLSDPAATGNMTYIGVLKDGVGGVDGLAGARGVFSSPDGKHVYAVGEDDNALAVFSRNETTGVLTQVQVIKDGVGGVDGLAGARDVTVSPDGKYVYAVGYTDNAIAIFSRNATTGVLTYVGVLKDGVGGVDGLANANSVTISADGRHAYVSGRGDNAVSIFSRNLTTGALIYTGMVQDGVGGVDGLANANSVTISADGKHAYISGSGDNAVAIFSRNATTGALTYVGMVKDGVGGVDGLASAGPVNISPDGRYAYVAGSGDSAVSIFSRNTTTGALTYVGMVKDGVGGADGLTNVTAVNISPDGRYVYAVGAGENAVAIFTRNATTGALTYVGKVQDGVGGVDGLFVAFSTTISPDGKYIYVTGLFDNSVAAFSLDIADSVRFTTTLDVTPLPELTGWNPASRDLSAVQSAPRLIDADVTLAGGPANYNTWVLSLISSVGAQDLLGVRNEGTGAGQIGVSGANISYGGTNIGTFTSANGVLTITLNANATAAAVEKLIENFNIRNITSGPALERTLTVQLKDPASDGGLTPLATTTVGGAIAASQLLISPDGKFAYVYTVGANQFLMFSRDAQTGALTSIGNITSTLVGSVTYAMSPDGKHVYMDGGNGIQVFARNETTGVLTSAFVYTAQGTLNQPVISTDGAFVFFPTTTGIKVYSRDESTGALTLVETEAPANGTDAVRVGVSADGKYLFAGTWDAQLEVYEIGSGGLTYKEVVTVTSGEAPYEIHFGPDQRVYVRGDMDGISIYTYNGSGVGAVLSEVVGQYYNNGGNAGLSFSADGDYIYAASTWDLRVEVLGIGGGGLSIVYVQGPSNFAGDTALSPDGRYLYVVNADNNIDIFEVSVGQSTQAQATMEFTVPANSAPAGTDNTLTINEDTTHTFTAANFGFTDPDGGDSLSAVRIDTLPANGTLRLSGVAVTAGQVITTAQIANLTFAPAANANGAAYASFTFSVRDQSSVYDPSPNTMTFNVTAVNDAPAGTDNTLTIDEDTTHTFTAADFGFSDVDAGDSLKGIRIDTVPANGQLLFMGAFPITAGDELTLANIAQLTYVPNANGNGIAFDSFTFSVKDQSDVYDPTPNTMTFNVTPVADPPVITGWDPTVSFNENTVNAGWVILDSDVTVTGDGNYDFTLIFYTEAQDSGANYLSIRNQGSGPGQIGIVGNTVTYGGVVIATVFKSDGAMDSTSRDIVIKFNGNASNAAVEALIENVQYSYTSDNPLANRSVFMRVEFGGGLEHEYKTPPGSYSYHLWSDGTYYYTNVNGDSLAAYTWDGTNWTMIDSVAIGVFGKVYGDANYIYHTNGSTIRVFTFNGSDLSLVHTYDTGNTIRYVYHDGDDLFVSTGNTVQQLTFNGTSFTIDATLNAGGSTHAVWSDGTYYYVGADLGGSMGIRAYTFDGSNFTLVGQTSKLGTKHAITGDGSFVYVLVGGNIEAYTFNGTAFTLVATQPLPNASNTLYQDIKIYDGQIFVAAGGEGIKIYEFNGATFSYVSGQDRDGQDTATLYVDTVTGTVFSPDAWGGMNIYSYSKPETTIIFEKVVTVIAENDAPAGANNTITINEDTSHTFTAANFGFTDPDGPGDSLSAVRIDTLPVNGTLRLSGVAVTAGQIILVADIANLTFTPAPDANGVAYASFAFSVRDQAGAYDAAPNTVTFNVTPVSELPTITGWGDAITYNENALNAAGWVLLDTDVTVTGSGNYSFKMMVSLSKISGIDGERLTIRHQGNGAG